MAKFCSKCGSALTDGAKFCTVCGTATTESKKFCSKCGSAMNGGAKFCPKCGSSAAQPVKPPVVTPPVRRQIDQQPAQVPQKLVYNQPPHQPAQNTKSQAAPVKKKKVGAVIAIVLASVTVVSVVITALVVSGLLKNRPAVPGSGKAVSTETVKVPEDGVVKTDMGVTVDLSLFFEAEEAAELTVKKMNSVTDGAIGATYTAYDFSLGKIHEFDGYVELRLPYSAKSIEAGQSEEECVGGMYYNEKTGEWENVVYTVDTANKEVVILTDHFSTYGCFEFENEGKRTAKITKVYPFSVADLDPAAVKAAMRETIDNDGEPGEKCRELMGNYLAEFMRREIFLDEEIQFGFKHSEMATIVTNVATLLSATPGVGSALDRCPITSDLMVALGYAGQYTTLMNAIFMNHLPDKTDHEILGMYKDYAYSFLSKTKSKTLGTIGAAVWCIDCAITEMGNYAYNKVGEDTKKAYRQYMDTTNNYSGKTHKPRTLPEWRKVIYRIAKNAVNNRDNIDTAIIDEIDRYCNEFWTLSDEAITNIYIDVGQTGRGLPDAATKAAVTREYKGELLSKLQGVFAVVQRDLQADLDNEQLDRFWDVKNILNRRITVEISEKTGDDDKYKYAGHTVAFAPLNNAADKEDWRLTLDKYGSKSVVMTYIGWVIAGQPERIELYAPGKTVGKDAPERTVEFTVTAPKTKIVIETEASDNPFVGVWKWTRSDGLAERTLTVNADGTGKDKWITYDNGTARVLTNVGFTYELDGNRMITNLKSGEERIIMIYSKENDTIKYTVSSSSYVFTRVSN